MWPTQQSILNKKESIKTKYEQKQRTKNENAKNFEMLQIFSRKETFQDRKMKKSWKTTNKRKANTSLNLRASSTVYFKYEKCRKTKQLVIKIKN